MKYDDPVHLDGCDIQDVKIIFLKKKSEIYRNFNNSKALGKPSHYEDKPSIRDAQLSLHYGWVSTVIKLSNKYHFASNKCIFLNGNCFILTREWFLIPSVQIESMMAKFYHTHTHTSSRNVSNLKTLNHLWHNMICHSASGYEKVQNEKLLGLLVNRVVGVTHFLVPGNTMNHTMGPLSSSLPGH